MVIEKLFKEIKAHIQEVTQKETALGKSLWKEFVKLHPADIAQFLSHVDSDCFEKLFLNLPQKNMCAVFS